MHLSMLSPRVGGGGGFTYEKLTQRTFPWVAILTVCRCPGVENLALASIKMSNSPGSAPPPPPHPGLNIDRRIMKALVLAS